jgi:phytoene dehydrogenase-like protein
MDAHEIYEKLLDPALMPAGFKKRLQTTPVNSPAFNVCIVTDLGISGLPFKDADSFVSPPLRWGELSSNYDADKIPIRLSFPTELDPERRVNGGKKPNAIQIMTMAPFEYENYWRGGPDLKRGEDYDRFKHEYAMKLVRRLEQYVPGLSEHILAMDIATPITYYRYTLNYKASGLGWSDFKSWNQKVPFVKGLYQAGMWVGGGEAWTGL